MKSATIYWGRLSTRGRMTIPAPIRRKLGIRGGTRMTLKVTPTGAFIFSPLPKLRSRG
jgi:AbrB family looped-hinge helix DNA binding protein